MSKFKFEKHTDQIIKWYQEGKTYVEIANLLDSQDIKNDSQNIRRLIRNTLGDVHGNRKIVITEDVKLQIDNLLQQGKRPKEISDILHIKYPTICGYLRNCGYKFLPDKGNVHYFDIIDSYAKAYIVGFIAADGAIVKAKTTTTLTITIKYEDRAVLDFIKSEIGNTHELKEIRRPSSYDKTKMIHHIRYAISDNNITKALINLGITPNKSLAMGNIIKNIPYKYRDAFIIGYFDGDGSVTIRDGIHNNSSGRLVKDYSLYIQMRGTRDFFLGVCKHLNIDPSHIHKHDSIPQLCFASKKDTYRFYQCYANLPFYYERKHDKFLQRINHHSYDKYKQVQTISSST